MTYSHTQISQYLACPRRYQHRYLDGWKEKDTRAAILFGRAFERALGAYFRREDPGAVLFDEWSACQSQDLHDSNGDSWDRMLRQGIMLLTRYCQDDRIQVYQLDAICRSSSPGRLPERTTSSATSMPSAGLTANVACSSGRPARADTPKSLRDCCLWIRNLFAPG